jgi:hypothetical protein
MYRNFNCQIKARHDVKEDQVFMLARFQVRTSWQTAAPRERRSRGTRPPRATCGLLPCGYCLAQGPQEVHVIKQLPRILCFVLFVLLPAHVNAQIYQAVSRRGELAQLDTTFSKYLGCLVVYKIALVIDYLADSNLCYLDTAGQARARIAV